MDDSLQDQRWWTRRRRSFAWLLLVLAVCIAGFVLVYLFTVHTVQGRVLEDTVLRGAARGAALTADTVAAVLDVITVTSLLVTVAVVAVIALIRMRRTLGLAAIAVLVVANLASRILKSYVLPRPDLGLDESAPATLNSLPSGHTTAAFSIGVALLLVVPRALRPVTAIAVIASSSVVAMATMSAGWHRPGDSVASFLLVTGCAAAIGLTLLPHESRDGAGPPRGAPDPGVRGLLGVIGAGLVLLSGLLVVAVGASPQVRDASIGPPLAFVTSCLLLAATAMVCTATVLGIVARIDPVRPAGSAGRSLGPGQQRTSRRPEAPNPDPGQGSGPG